MKPNPLYNHAEAFCLMNYACPCGHREVIWNSRDGVTAFGCGCPSCGKPTLTHTQFHRDHPAPGHKPHYGQRMWVAMTMERALEHAKRIAVERFGPSYNNEAWLNKMAEDMCRNGEAPDLRVNI